MKNKQLILMCCALLVTLSFFLPWAKMDSEFDTFKSTGASYNGMTVISAIGYGVQMVSAFGTAYGFHFPAQILYLGYVIALIPILGIAGFIFLGLKKPGGKLMIRIQTIVAILFAVGLIILSNSSADMKILVDSLIDVQFGFYLMLIAAIVGFIFTFLIKKGSRRHA